MLEPLIKAIQGDVKPEKIGDYFTRPVYLRPADPKADAIQINTLTGLVDYIQSDVDGEAEDYHVQVISPTVVKVCNMLTADHRQRETLLTADCGSFIGGGFPFAQWLDQERFIIAALSTIQGSEQRAAMMSIVGNIVDEDVRESNDNGVTQNVTTRAGIARKADTEVPNPITLSPYRTFPEIKQPESPFVLRMKRDSGIRIALFEAGGGAWKCDAVQAIAEYLREKLPNTSVLA